METRFGIKDFVLYALVITLGVMFVLGRQQYDRQYTKLLAIEAAAGEQTKDLASLRRMVQRSLANPARTAAAGSASRPAGDDPFARVRAAQALPDYAAGDWLVQSIPNTDKITPLVSGDVYAADIQSHVLQTLVQRDPVTLDYKPLLALPGWTIEDHVAAYHAFVDPKVAAGAKADDVANDPACPAAIKVTFHVRPGVVFSDGQPLTADDVAWTFDFIMDKDVAAPRARSGLSKIRRAVRTGTDAVTFEFAAPYFDPLALAGEFPILPKHWYGGFAKEAFNKSAGLLMGSGPYKLADPQGWSPGKPLELVRNDRYWGEPPALDKLVYRVINADLPRLTAFKNGELDYYQAQPEQYADLLADPDIAARANHFEYDTATAGYRFIAWNQVRDGKPTHFADKRVRQALTMLTDRQRMCDEIMLHLATIATGPFNRLGQQADPAVQPWPYDVARAKKLLADAGYTDDGHGAVRDAAGVPLTIRLTYPNGSANYDRMVLSMRDSYARAGVALEPEKLDWSVFSQRMKKRDFDAISLGWSAGIEGDIYQMFDSSQRGDEGDNFMGYSNPELDGLIRRARETLDPAVRMPLWRRCHDIIHEDQPYTFLFTRRQTVFVANRVHDVLKLPLGLNDVDEWFVPDGVQKYQR